MKRERPGPPPVGSRLCVVLRQLTQEQSFGPDGPPETPKAYLARLLKELAEQMGCADLDLDHHPALRLRKYNPNVRTIAARYTPHAHDPEYLFYRPRDEHRIKTNIRGDGAQFPDRVLINRERKRDRRHVKKRKAVWAKRKLKSANRWPPRGSRSFSKRMR